MMAYHLELENERPEHLHNRPFTTLRRYWMKVRSWPIPAVQAMKFIHGRPTATCDPKRAFEQKCANVRY